LPIVPVSEREIPFNRHGKVPGVFHETVDQDCLLTAPYLVGDALYPCSVLMDELEPLFPVLFSIKR